MSKRRPPLGHQRIRWLLPVMSTNLGEFIKYLFYRRKCDFVCPKNVAGHLRVLMYCPKVANAFCLTSFALGLWPGKILGTPGKRVRNTSQGHLKENISKDTNR